MYSGEKDLLALAAFVAIGLAAALMLSIAFPAASAATFFAAG